MEEVKNTFLSPNNQVFLEKYLAEKRAMGLIKGDKDKSISSVVIYEKFRVALEYQEEHLILKNAIARILRRKFTLASSSNLKQIFTDLVNELTWASYINPEELTDANVDKIKFIIEKYYIFQKNVRSLNIRKHELNKMIIDWAACEIDEVLQPNKSKDLLIDYTYSLLRQNLNYPNGRISEETNEIQLKLAINLLLLKPDLHLVQYWLINKIYPRWKELNLEEVEKVSRSFDPFYNKIDHEIHHPLRKRYLSYVKKLIAPFILLKSVLSNRNIDLELIKTKPQIFQKMLMDEYETSVRRAKQKVIRGTFRAFIFILLTKISLAFIIEIPFDRLILGHVDLVSLITNISLPPIIMFIAGMFVKSPSVRNYKIVSDATSNMLLNDKIDDRVHELVQSGVSKSHIIFNVVYPLISLTIIGLVSWLLFSFKFTIVSVCLFFLFVSVVSFFSFRIRGIALELAMKRTKDDPITTLFELAFMPFIRIGKYFSDQLSAFNPMIYMLDLFIEAPLKTIIKIINSWFRFINAKKEELEF